LAFGSLNTRVCGFAFGYAQTPPRGLHISQRLCEIALKSYIGGKKDEES